MGSSGCPSCCPGQFIGAYDQGTDQSPTHEGPHPLRQSNRWGHTLKLIPPVPSPNTKSSGERLFFDVLSKVDLPGWTAFHSLSVSQHEHKRWAELDFVLLSSEGLIALEVKGGRVSAADGVWTFTDRWGEEHRKSESPFKQAQYEIMGLKERLEGEILPAQLRALPLGYGVVFPQVDFGLVSVEWAPETVLDRARMSSPDAVAKWLRRLAQHWQEQTHTRGGAPAELLQRVQNLLRPSFDRAPSLRYRVDEAVTVMDRFTEEQYHQLDFIEDNPRLVCEGGAGTGKTFLAAELARRSVARGRKVLFTCWSPVLAAFVRARIPAEVTVAAWDDLDRLAGEQFDSLILDEAQDVLTLTGLERLDPLLVGGLEAGNWAIFLDQHPEHHRCHGARCPEVAPRLRWRPWSPPLELPQHGAQSCRRG